RGHPAALPGAGAPVLAGAPPRALRRRPVGLRAAARRGHAPAAPAVRGGAQGGDRRLGGGTGMSGEPPPGGAEGPPVGAGPPRGPEAEAALADFRAWLANALEPPSGEPDGPEPEPVDLHTLAGHFVALRHEVNLQTRATRAQQEHSAEALRALQGALGALEK